MPQMNPMNWMMIFIMLIFILVIYICLLYFLIFKKKKIIKLNKINKNKFSFKW